MFSGARQQWTAAGQLTFASHFGTWDAEHYLQLMEAGYEPGAWSCAFYPLWPLSVKLVSKLSGASYVIAGVALANAFSLMGLVLFFRIVHKRMGREIATLSVLLLFFFPGALFFQFIYSESLFLFLLMILCEGLEKGRFGSTLVSAFLLPLTRAIGILCVVPIAWCLLASSRRANVAAWIGQAGSSDVSEPAISPGRKWCLLSAPFIGWGAYLALMWLWTGNAWEGFKAQEYWRVQSFGNLLNPLKFVYGFFTPTGWHQHTGSVLDRCVFIILINCLPVIWRLDRGWFVWTVVLGIVPAVSGTFSSFTRYASVVFPLFVALAVFLTKDRWKSLRIPVLAAFAILHFVLLWRFVNFRWAG